MVLTKLRFLAKLCLVNNFATAALFTDTSTLSIELVYILSNAWQIKRDKKDEYHGPSWLLVGKNLQQSKVIFWTMDINLGVLVVFVLIVGFLYRLLTKNNGYFHDKPIPSMAVTPFLGSTGPLMLRKYTFGDFVEHIYNKYPNAKYGLIVD